MGIDFNERVIRNTLLDENTRRFMSEQHWNYPTKGHCAKADEEKSNVREKWKSSKDEVEN